MGTSNAVREAEKRKLAKEQIRANMSEDTGSSEFAGAEIAYRRLHPVDSYSTKFMNKKDQFVLAVDKIDVPEVRTALIPTREYASSYAPDGKQTYDYTAKLSLNDGDEDAFRVLLATVKEHHRMKFSFDGSFEYMVLRVAQKGDAGVSFIFDLYDGGTVSGDSSAPSASAAFEVSKGEGRRNYTGKLVWEYAVTFHCLEDKRPKDAVIKATYANLQRFMRSVIASLGIVPSEL